MKFKSLIAVAAISLSSLTPAVSNAQQVGDSIVSSTGATWVWTAGLVWVMLDAAGQKTSKTASTVN